jgi:hypothetical protein
MESLQPGSIDSRGQMKATTDSESSSCRHHWVLGQPVNGSVEAQCRHCGRKRSYPAALDDYDWGLENERRYSSIGVATAAGGARPSSVALGLARDGALMVDYES